MSEIDTVSADADAQPAAAAAKPRKTRARAAPASRVPKIEMPDLEFTPEVEAATEPLYARVAHVVPRAEWAFHAPYVKAINDLKSVRNARILAHHHLTPDICLCVADVVGDALQLARAAAASDAAVLVQAGLVSMAETAKVLNPDRTVLSPDIDARSSLAASIGADDIRLLRERFPGVPVVVHADVSVEAKAEADVCCTSANAVAAIESLGAPRVIFVPDQHLARYVATRTRVKIIAWNGASTLHAGFTVAELAEYRAEDPGIRILAHPQCTADVIAAADFTGADVAMIDDVKALPGGRVVLLTEASLSDNLAGDVPQVEFVRTGHFSTAMKRITLETILDTLVRMSGEIAVAPDLAARARPALERMIRIGA